MFERNSGMERKEKRKFGRDSRREKKIQNMV